MEIINKAIERYERLAEEERNKGTEEEERRKMVIRKIKERNGDIEPCESEIQDMLDYLARCRANPKFIKELHRPEEKKSLIEWEQPKE